MISQLTERTFPKPATVGTEHGQSAPGVGASPQAAQPAAALSRLFFIDNLRWVLTGIVILHHLSITYGASGSWYYVEQPTNALAQLVLTLFTAFNQGYFMGLFFLIGGYFAAAALERKGSWRFIKDRLLRLGLPLLFFALLMSPVLHTFAWYQANPSASSIALWPVLLAEWRQLAFAPGPLWFVETLLAMSLLYTASRFVWRLPARPAGEHATPALTSGRITIFAGLIAALSFVTRLFMPIGVEWHSLQLAFFPQYIALFCAGLAAYHYRWLPVLPTTVRRTWRIVAAVAILALPVMMMVVAPDGDVTIAFGGWHWQAAGFAVWEAFYAVSMSVTLLALFRRRFDRQGTLGRMLSSSAYTVYIIHAPIVVALAYSMRAVAWHPLQKFALLAGPAVVICFTLAHLVVTHLPGAKRVL